MFYRKRKIKNVVLDVRSEAHFEAFLVKQGVRFLTVSNVSGVWREALKPAYTDLPIAQLRITTILILLFQSFQN